jgi:hypothetical protein
LFAEGADAERERSRVLAAAEGFWRALVAFPGPVRPEHQHALRSVHPGLQLELAGDGADDLVVRSDERALSPLVEEVVARAPSGRPVYARRPARPFERVAARFAASHGVTLDAARARAGFTRGHLLELVLHLPESALVHEQGERLFAEAVAEALLGERVLDDWVGAVDVIPLPPTDPRRRGLPVVTSDSPADLPLPELSRAITAAIAGLEAGLDPRPIHEQGELGWTMLEAEPLAVASDGGQDDIVLASTLLPELYKSFLRAEPFSSRRFSRAGERFAYLKLRYVHDSFERRLAERRALEDALDRSLRSAAAGCVFGNGLGLCHAYIDLALSDVAAGLALTRESARQCHAPRESWVLFFDADWASEWLGVWDDTPPPPGRPAPG